MKRILFVDDSQNVLEGLRRMLHRMNKEWDMTFVDDPHAALELLRVNQFDAIVSDMRMPGMNGAQLLSQIAREYPGTVRFILSGHSDHQLILQSVGCTHQFLAKPCDPAHLIASIRNSFVIRGMLNDEGLKAAVAQVPSLPTLPSTYTKLVKALRLECISLDSIAKLVAEDIGMTAKILQMVNSAFFGLPSRVENPLRAVSLLGMDTIKALVLTAGVFDQFNVASIGNLSLESIYSHSLQVGVMARKVAHKLSLDQRVIDDSQLAGMMHDIGKALLLMNFRDGIRDALHICDIEGKPLHVAEVQVMGVSHAEIGAYLLSLWGEMDPTVEAVLHHHRPSRVMDAKPSALTAVHIANALVHRAEYADIDEWRQKALDFDYLKSLNLDGAIGELVDACPAEAVA